MRHAGQSCALLLCAVLGCSDSAIIGGLCRSRCTRADAGSDACARVACKPDAGKPDAVRPDAGNRNPDASSADAGPRCSAGSHPLTRMQLDLMLVIDDTASVSPWLPALHDGLDQFLLEKDSSGVGVGLQRFDDVCDAQEYATPIVPIAPLPGNAAALEDALQLMLTASTSTTPALDGVLQYARTWASTHDGARVAVVLLTDASPGICDGLVGDYAGEAERLAREGYEGTPSIKTYVIGVGTMDLPSSIAQAGGTQPLPISVTPADGEVLGALDSVRNDAQPCAFSWESGWTLAQDSEVVATASDGTEHRYPILPDSSGCDQQDGFYVGNAAAAFPLIACPRSCAGIASGNQLWLSTACVAP